MLTSHFRVSQMQHKCLLVSVCVWLILCFSVVVFPTVSVFAGELTISPQFPVLNARVNFAYKPDSTWLNEKTLYVFVYRFREASGDPKADYVKLARGLDGVWTGDIAVNPTDVFWMMKVFNGKRADDNSGAFWETYITSDGAKPVQGAKLRAGITYLAALPETCSRSADFKKAIELMREEIVTYPNNISALIAETALSYELKIIKSDEHQKRMAKILTMPFDTTRENDARSVMRALNAVGRGTDAQNLQFKFIAKYPQSTIAEEYNMLQIQNAVNPQFFVDKIREYGQKFPASPNNPTLQSSAIAGYKEIGKLRQAGLWLDSISNASAMAYNELAKFMLRYDTTARAEAMKYAQKAITFARQNRIFARPAHVTELEWNISTAATVGDMYNTLSSAYFEEKRYDEALATFYQALDATKGEMPSPAYSQAVMLLTMKKQFSEALRIASQGTIMAGGGDNVLMRWHKTSMDSVMTEFTSKPVVVAPSTTSTISSTSATSGKQDSITRAERYAALYSAERGRLIDSAVLLNTYRQFLQRLDRPLLSGVYFNTNRKPFEIDSLKGKVTLIVFWSSWAEPCQKMMPYLNVMFKKYANSGVLNLVVIDTWEDRSSDRFKLVRDYMNKNKSLDVPIFVDDNDALAQKYGVMGVPMRLYIDKLGRIQYKASGFTDSAKFVQEVEDTFALLLNDRFYYFQ